MGTPNKAPIFTTTPNVSSATIPQDTAQPASNGACPGTTVNILTKAFTAGDNGSFVEKIRFTPVGAAAASSTATSLKAYLSTVAAPGATTIANTCLLGDITAVVCAAASLTAASPFYELQLGIAIPPGYFIHVSQSVAQVSAVTWQATVFGGDY